MPRTAADAHTPSTPRWSGPDSVEAFARALRVPVKTMRKLLREQKLLNRRLTRTRWQVNLDDLPEAKQARFGGLPPEPYDPLRPFMARRAPRPDAG